MSELFFEWSSWVFGLVGVLLALGWIRSRKKSSPDSKAKISIKNSPGADAVGRDRNAGSRNSEPHEAEIEIKDSENAKATGRDDRQK